jgi:hypothetical protein
MWTPGSCPRNQVVHEVKEDEFKVRGAGGLVDSVERFATALGPVSDAIDAVEDLMHWERPNATLLFFLLYILFVW